ncbi:MAG: cytochrome ubiquinol oxidase subunit I [Nitrospirota bacterium]|nr:cytochrome ubiquinol oxidase subunit I [Nitrospirota bacterium]
MNFPVWDVWFGSGILIAIVAVVHVFVSHFAVGGGLFLVLTERKAYRENDSGLLSWLKLHSAFFVLVTVVWGAVTGVGIWWTIALVHPQGTSALIHIFVWFFGIEWVFFLIEIVAALMYYYGWEKLDRRTHLWFGWVYFVAAWMSLLTINGIIDFMLTPGKWLEDFQVWNGFFNPTYFPSLFFRSFLSFALAGVYALITAAWQKDPALKAKVVRWSSIWVLLNAILAIPAAYWYTQSIPPAVWAFAKGTLPAATHSAMLIGLSAFLAFVFAFIAWILAKKTPLVLSLLVFLAAFSTVASFELLREILRKPYVIFGYMYGNSIYSVPLDGDRGLNLPTLNERGVLRTANWVQTREIHEDNMIQAGREIFRLECQACHSLGGYRDIGWLLRRKQLTGQPAILAILGVLDKIPTSNVMPPFAGTAKEKEALSHFLTSVAQSNS